MSATRLPGLSVILCAVITVGLLGCAHDPILLCDEPAPPQALAILRPAWRQLRSEGGEFRQILSIAGGEAWSGRGEGSEVHLPADRYLITVGWDIGGDYVLGGLVGVLALEMGDRIASRYDKIFDIELLPGHVYQLHQRHTGFHGANRRYWIEDLNTGETFHPSEEESP